MDVNQLRKIKISVRNLVEFLMRSGDIDNRRVGFSEKTAMLEGGKIHRKIQKRMGTGYTAEYPLKMTIETEMFELEIEGRADGIFIKEELTVVDEIKGMYKKLDQIKEAAGVHKAQALCYAYMYAEQKGLSKIGIQLTYCNLETEELKYFEEQWKFKKLRKWFDELIGEYEKWAALQADWKIHRVESIRKTKFPFSYRAGQKEVAAAVYRTIQKKKKIFLQAPTGVGKTISTVFPAIKAVGEGLGDKIFYLTAKTITRTVAEQTFDILKSQGLDYKVITITAKEKLCLCEEMECNPIQCPYAKGHFDRVNDALYHMLTAESSYTRDILWKYAERHQVCPFEMCLDATLWSDAVICDYNYVFAPNVKLKRYFTDGMKGEYIFLIDESHNLAERAKEMYSADVYKEDFVEIKNILTGYYKKLIIQLDRCNKILLEYKRECDKYTILKDANNLVVVLMGLMVELEKYLEESTIGETQKKVLGFYLEIKTFLDTYQNVDDNYVIYSEHTEEGKFRLRLFCVEPAQNLKKCLDQGNSTVFFSATLLPIQYYKRMLSTETDDFSIYAKSPFKSENRILMIGSDISSKYTRRNRTEYHKMCQYVNAALKAKAGNYFIFFPSYQLMNQIYQYFCDEYKDESVQCYIQKPYMDEQDREQFLAVFEENRSESRIGFCVIGGIFSEGIDLKYESLIGVFIIGTGLPGICNEREILRSYYNRKGMDGFAYAYRYIGMNKVLQAAGRVIRTGEDVGSIILMDERFQDMEYQQLFPKEWDEYTVCKRFDVGKLLEIFWQERDCSF